MSWDILSKANLQYLLTRLKEVTDSIKRGHTIKDDSSTSLAQKDDMQFGGVYSHNDGTTTKVDIVREFNSPSAVEALTGEAAKGFQHIPDTIYRGRTASDIGFDKTGTSFNSTRVQDVLEEVDSRIDNLNADDIPYSSGVSVKDKLDELSGKFLIYIPPNTYSKYSEALTAIRTEYYKLSAIEQRRTVILFANYMMAHVVHVNAPRFTYCMGSVDANYIATFELDTRKYYVSTIDASGTSFQDNTESTQGSSIGLMII